MEGLQFNLQHTATLVRVGGSIIDQHIDVADLCLDSLLRLLHALWIGDVQVLIEDCESLLCE